MIGSKEAKRIEKLLQEFGGTNLYITNYANVAYEIPYGAKLVLPESEDSCEVQNKRKHIGGDFMKIYQRSDNILMKYCTPGEYMFLAKLKQFVSFNENILRKGGHSNGHLLKSTEIAKDLDMGKSTISEYIKFFNDVNIIKEYELTSKDNPKDKNKCLVVNPWIYSKGTAMLKDVQELFNGTYWHYISNLTNEEKENIKEIDNIEGLNPILQLKAKQLTDFQSSSSSV